MLDTSDTGSLASSWVLLNELLSNKKDLEGKPILIVLNKTDIADSLSRTLTLNVLRINDLVESSPGAIHIFSGSSMDLKLAEEMLKWMAAVLVV